MAIYKPENSANAIRMNGPANPVRSINYPELVFTRGAAREWTGCGKTYQNFGALICEWASGLEDAPDPYEEAIKFFAESRYGGKVNALVLTNAVGKKHALEIINKVILAKPS